MAVLVTLDEARTHLGILVAGAYDARIDATRAAASALVVDYLGARADPAWTELTVPRHVHQGVLYAVAHLWEHRGDDMSLDQVFWEALGRILRRSRDPSVA